MLIKQLLTKYHRTDASKVPPLSKVPPPYFGKIPEIHLDPSKVPPSNFNISGQNEANFVFK